MNSERGVYSPRAEDEAEGGGGGGGEEGNDVHGGRQTETEEGCEPVCARTDKLIDSWLPVEVSVT